MRALLFLLALTSPALAGWDVTTHVDPMTDRSFTVATARAADLSLQVQCGSVALIFPRPVAFGELSMSYRLDNGPVVPRFAGMASDGRTAWPVINMAALTNAKRLRVTVYPPGRSPAFYDLDLSGGGLSGMRCGR